MSYKTIVVHVDDSRHAQARIEAAAAIAAQENAHLIGTAMTGVSRFLYETLAVSPEDPGIAPHLHTLRERARNSLLKFEGIAQSAGVTSFETRLVDDEVAEGFSLQARYCDLVVLGQYDRDDRFSTLNFDLPEYVVLNGGSPALVAPNSDTFNGAIERVLIAWNGSVQAAHAVRGALPLLKRAKMVEVAVFHPPSKPESQAVPAGADIATYLARHDVKTEVMLRTCNETAAGDISGRLLSLAAELSSDLLVMGCYGHSRFREVLLGGATRIVLEKMDIPVLMAH
jgi:nucleotide-binding universal stress UspA family protein